MFVRVALIALPLLLLGACGGAVVWTVDERKPYDYIDGAYLSYVMARGEMTVSASYTKADSTLSLTVEQTSRAVPDFAHQHVLAYGHGALSADQVSVSFDGPLLKKVSSTTKDQSVAAVQAINALLTQVAATQKALAPPGLKIVSAESNPCNTDMKFVVIVDVTYRRQQPATAQQASPNCKIRIVVNVDRPITTLGVVGFPSSVSDKPTEESCNYAVCFRLGGVFPVTATATLIGPDGKPFPKEDPARVNARVNVLAPQHDAIGFVRFNRRAFVENETTVTFANGMVSEFSAKNPSEVVGFLQLPTELLKSVVLTVPLVR